MQIPKLNKKVLIITGPTASGKSDVAIRIAKEINGYIINADSMQVYKELKIGTAQPIPDSTYQNKWKISGVDHYLYGYVSIQKNYNVSQYQSDVYEIMSLEENKDRVPILVGGTGLYIDAVIKCFNLRDEKESNRKTLLNKSVTELQSMLTEYEKKQLNESDINNPRRLIRVIERGIAQPSTEELPHIYYVLDPGKEILNKRIKKRVEKMFELGLKGENQLLHDNFSNKHKALKAIGYYEFTRYFQGHATIEQLKDRIRIHTKQYAKRQRTWFKRKENAIWVRTPEELYQLAIKAFK